MQLTITVTKHSLNKKIQCFTCKEIICKGILISSQPWLLLYRGQYPTAYILLLLLLLSSSSSSISIHPFSFAYPIQDCRHIIIINNNKNNKIVSLVVAVIEVIVAVCLHFYCYYC